MKLTADCQLSGSGKKKIIDKEASLPLVGGIRRNKKKVAPSFAFLFSRSCTTDCTLTEFSFQLSVIHLRRTFGREKDAAPKGGRARETDREKEGKRGGAAAAFGLSKVRAEENGVGVRKRYSYSQGVSIADTPETARFKSPEGILLTVTSIQRTERPGDARPPENRGHVTDPPHPDP